MYIRNVYCQKNVTLLQILHKLFFHVKLKCVIDYLNTCIYLYIHICVSVCVCAHPIKITEYSHIALIVI